MATGPFMELLLRKFEFDATVDWTRWRVCRVCTRRSEREVLAQDCGFTGPPPPPGMPPDPRAVPRVGMWAGGVHPPPGVLIGGEVASPPPYLFSGVHLPP
jgi:hypothetical protein